MNFYLEELAERAISDIEKVCLKIDEPLDGDEVEYITKRIWFHLNDINGNFSKEELRRYEKNLDLIKIGVRNG